MFSMRVPCVLGRRRHGNLSSWLADRTGGIDARRLLLRIPSQAQQNGRE
ncbi:MAG: hypothetical protein JOY79_11260 [Acidobacteriaceae bacterium]|nr:hypothetical protein [Acidobacteriaceae bacterium]